MTIVRRLTLSRWGKTALPHHTGICLQSCASITIRQPQKPLQKNRSTGVEDFPRWSCQAKLNERSMAERGGFEPPVRCYTYNALAKRRYRPLSHLSSPSPRSKGAERKVQGHFLAAGKSAEALRRQIAFMSWCQPNETWHPSEGSPAHTSRQTVPSHSAPMRSA